MIWTINYVFLLSSITLEVYNNSPTPVVMLDRRSVRVTMGRFCDAAIKSGWILLKAVFGCLRIRSSNKWYTALSWSYCEFCTDWNIVKQILYQKTINQYYIKRLSTNMKKAISTLVSGITSKKGQIKMINKLFANVNYVLFYKVTVICRSGSGCIEGWKGKDSLCYWIKNCKELFGIQSVMCQIKGGSKRTRSVTS